MTYTYRGTIYPWNCDHMGHMNVQFYVAKFDEASWSFFNSIGLNAIYLKKSGSGLVALEQKISYKKEVLAGDSIYIASKVLEKKEKTLTIWHQMRNSATHDLIAETELVGLYIDTTERKGIKLPTFVSESAKPRNLGSA